MSRRYGPPARAAVAAGAAAGMARAGYAMLRSRPPGGAAAWTRTNHRGEAVTLLEGPAAALGAALASALAPGLSPRGRAALAAAGAGAAAFGGYDDLAGSGGRRGFRGHLGALARGEVTTGAVKLGGIVRDSNGLAEGGLRHVFVQVPVGYNSSTGCPLYGTYTPWSAAKIKSLYRTHRFYVNRVRKWSATEVKRGSLLPEDRADVLRKARGFTAPWTGKCTSECRAPLGL